MTGSARAPAIAAAGLALLLPAARPARAQHAPADTVAGRVVAVDSTPIARATVRLAAEGMREQAVLTDTQGRYRFVISGGPGEYVVSASAFGYLSFSAAVAREPGTARATRDLRLNARPMTLDTVMAVLASPGREKPTAAERAGEWSAVSSEGLADPGNLAEVAALEAGVTRVGADGAGLSIAGQASDQNGTTLDGASYGGGGTLPSEGVRGVAVYTSSYDVSRGQFSGGQVAATTLAGTNLWGGSLTTHLEDPALLYGGAPGGVAGRAGRRLRLNGGGGGALVRDRLFVFGAVDLAHGSRAGTGLELLDSASLRRLAVAPDSARRLIEIARDAGAASPAAALVPATGQDLTSLLGRLDYTPSRRQQVTLRVDWRAYDAGGFGSAPLRLLGGAGEQRSRGGGVFLEHAATGGVWANELRVYRSLNTSGVNNGPPAPTGQVNVASTLADGSTGVSVLSFGGVPFSVRDRHSLWSLGDELKVAAAGEHMLKAGVLLQEERALYDAAQGRGGVFTFNSLADLERNRPALYTRTLATRGREAVRRYGALYLGDSWRRGERLSIVMGVRVDATAYGRRPALAPGADSLTGGHGAQAPGEVVVTPRLGVRYGAPGGRGWTVQAGAGGFAGLAALDALAARWGDTGAAEATLVCVGPAAPVPEWRRYASDPSAVPSTCARETSPFSSAAPQAAVFSSAYGAPRTWRASLGASRMLVGTWGLSLDALLARGTHLPNAVERNFSGTPAFMLAGEGGRPVYAEPGQIDPITGGIAPGAARLAPALGPVLEVGARGRSWTGQLTAALNGGLGRRMQVGVAYTLTRARALGGGVPGPGITSFGTAGDPGAMEWADAPFAPRHQLQVLASGRVMRRLRVSAVGRLSSGLPFTPSVGGDVNGDGYANDRAFVFEPARLDDPSLAAAMRALLDYAPDAARACLRAQTGRVASPGACHTSWSPSLDLRAEMLAVGNVNTRRLALTLTASNVTAGLDYLLHGPDGLHGWGQYPSPDATLLRVRGFDPARQAFRYEVNPAFGRPLGGGAFRLPFRIALQARVTAGADPRYQPLMQAIELGSGRARASVRTDLARRVPNLPAVLLHLNSADTTALMLTAVQRARLRALADSLAPAIAAVVDSLTDVCTEKAAPAVRAARLQELTRSAATLTATAAGLTRERLTAEQWTRVPGWLTRPPREDELDRPPTMQMDLPMGAP